MSFLTSFLNKTKDKTKRIFKKKKPISVDTPVEELLDGNHDLPSKQTPTPPPMATQGPSPFNDPSIPWFRRWFMFAFVYPTIISVMLKLILG